MNLCPICSGRGYVLYDDERGYTYSRECDCGLAEEERQKNKLKFANVPMMYRDIKFKDIKLKMYAKEDSRNQLKVLLTSIKYWLDKIDTMKENGRGLYLYSKTKGSGKTMTAAAIANTLIQMGERVKFSTSTQIIQEIKSSWDKETGISESQLLYDLSNVDFLVIDDFGTETVRDWICEKFYNIINNRYIEKKVTIFTSNSAIADLDYDERITNRITERSFSIHFPEESVRTYIAQMQEEDFTREVVKTMKGGE